MNEDSSPTNSYPGNQYPGNQPQGYPKAPPYGAPAPGYAPPPGYQAPPGYGPPPPWRPSKPYSNKAIVGMIFAGCGLFLFPVGIILNLVGAGLGLSGMKDTHPENGTHRGRGLAVAALWCNIGMWIFTVAIGGLITFAIVKAVEKEERQRVERRADRAQEDMRKIEERLELYYVENNNSLGPGGPVVKDGWEGGLFPENHPKVNGQLRLEDLVRNHDLRNPLHDYDLQITGARSATITHRNGGRKLVITDVSRRHSHFEG